MYPRTSVHHMVSLSRKMMELASATGFLKVNGGVVLEFDTNVALVLFRVNVVKAIREPTEVTELEGMLDEVLGLGMIDEVLGVGILDEVLGVGMLDEVLGLEKLEGELLRLVERIGDVVEKLLEFEGRKEKPLEELPKLVDRLYCGDDAVDRILRIEEALARGGCDCGCSCGCSCGCNCGCRCGGRCGGRRVSGGGSLGGPFGLTVGTTRDV